jgi:hypothetical protein
MIRPLFLRLLLLDSLFGCALAAGGVAYPHIHPVALVAIVVVLVAFAAGAAVLLWIAWRGEPRDRLLGDVAELCELTPGLALLGTAAGFLIALSGDAADVQQRISGAATGIVSTIVGVASWLVLSAELRMVGREAPSP